jgi:hypothetical protein
MFNLIGKLLYKIVPRNWYITKRVCDIVTKLCNDPVLRDDVKVYLAMIMIIVIVVGFTVCYRITYKYKIKKLLIK